MKIQGVQKLTLLDFPEKVACIVFTPGCNFRCPFCHNASLVTNIPDESEWNEEMFFEFLKKRQGMLEGVCVTGGEPLLQSGIEDFIRKVKELGFMVKLDTNGSFPEKLKTLVQKNLVDYVAMDIKNSQESYGITAGVDDRYMDAVRESVDFLKNGNLPFEFRTTVIKHFHTEEEFERIGKWISGAEKYYLQKFKNSGDLINNHIQGCADEEMEKFLEIVQKYVPNTQIRG